MKIHSPTVPTRLGHRTVKTTAASLGVLLTFASVAPPFALAEHDSEGEGTAPPGLHLPGLEEEPTGVGGGAETALETVPIVPAEEVDEAPPLADEPEPLPPETEEPTTPPATEAPPPPVEAEVVAPPAEPVVTAPAPPSYESAPPEPEYQPASPPEPVRNEAIVAPAADPGHGSSPDGNHHGVPSDAVAPEESAVVPEPGPEEA